MVRCSIRLLHYKDFLFLVLLSLMEGQVNNIDTMVVIILAFILLRYRQSTTCKVFLYRATFESDFLEGEEFHTAFGWLVKHKSTWCVTFSQKVHHRLLSWSHPQWPHGGGHWPQLAPVVFFLQPLVQALLAPVVVPPVATGACGLFPSTHWHTYSTCARVTCTVWWWYIRIHTLSALVKHCRQ